MAAAATLSSQRLRICAGRQPQPTRPCILIRAVASRVVRCSSCHPPMVRSHRHDRCLCTCTYLTPCPARRCGQHHRMHAPLSRLQGITDLERQWRLRRLRRHQRCGQLRLRVKQTKQLQHRRASSLRSWPQRGQEFCASRRPSWRRVHIHLINRGVVGRLMTSRVAAPNIQLASRHRQPFCL